MKTFEPLNLSTFEPLNLSTFEPFNLSTCNLALKAVGHAARTATLGEQLSTLTLN
ncbi:hypothetical protein [Moorena bouillonii]|uniref:hypothetical protein n=1 Tax=Moorena bouillonii TaxID=207920 RepID=UPI00130151EA|nr:hypothetical protein [Moorena bouillonii]